MSIWTPHGEHDVPRDENSGSQPQGEVGGPPGFDDLSPEEQEQAVSYTHLRAHET